MKHLNNLVVFLIIALLLVSCKDKRNNALNNKTPITYNFVILIDLSDRLLVKDQSKLDKELITYIYSIFEQKVKNKIFIYSKDKFKIVVAEQKDFTVDPILLQNELNFDLTNIESDASKIYIKKKDYMINFKKKFINALDILFGSATIYTNSYQYKGVDMWKYFSQNLEFDLTNDSNVQNYLFIFTDGYFDYEDYKDQKRIGNKYSSSYFLKDLRMAGEKWEEKFDKKGYGLIPTGKKFQNTSVMVLEVNPKVDFIDEFDLLKKVWYGWFDEMDIKKISILKKNRIETTKEQINKFIDSK
jgi:hypothetical protein